MPGIDYTLGIRNRSFMSGIDGAMGKLRGMAAGFTKIAAPVGAIAGVASLTAGLGKAFSKAAEMETLETAFMPLLGSAKAAQERIAELSRFAASTPFELPEIATASRTLETLTRGAISTGDGLRLVGDVAAATNQPFELIATTIGRLYDGLDSGRPVGEAMARLQELGVISGDTRGQLERLQAEGVKGADAWAVAEQAMGRFSGGMALQSQTWSGKMSTLKDNIGLTFAAFGTPIIDAVSPFLDSTISATSTLTEKAAEFGKKIGETIQFVAAAFQTGNITTILGEGMKIAFMESVNFLWKSIRATISAAGQYLIEAFRTAVTYFEVLTTADFWKGMGNAIVGVFLGAIGFLQKGLAEALEIARPLAELFGKGATIDAGQRTLRNSARILDEEAASRFGDAGDQLGPLADKVARRWQEAGENIAQRFQDQFAATADVLDPSGARAKLDQAFADVRAHVAKNTADADAAKAQMDAMVAKPETNLPASAATPAAAAQAARQVQADRLRQIGGYVGTGMSAAKDRIAEKTEQWTRESARYLERLVQHATAPKPAAQAGGAAF